MARRASGLKRWVCPSCASGKLAPGRPRKDDVRRYCLPCSEKTGRLVERTCPALEAERTKRAERAKTKREKARKREQAKALAKDPYDIRGWFWRCQKLPAFATGHWLAQLRGGGAGVNRWKRVTLDLMGGYGGGRAWSNRILVRTGGGEAWQIAILVHEMAHVINRWRGGKGHDDGWRSIYGEAIKDLTGEELSWRTGHRYSDNGATLVEEWLRQKRGGGTVTKDEGALAPKGDSDGTN
jgi:hypothetical protein